MYSEFIGQRLLALLFESADFFVKDTRVEAIAISAGKLFCYFTVLGTKLNLVVYSTLSLHLVSPPFNVVVVLFFSFHSSAIQLFYTVRNMFELYLNVVPTYHKQHLVSKVSSLPNH